MKIITQLVDLIDEELDGAKHYIKMARREHDTHPQLSAAFAELAEAEMGHVKILHTEAARIIENYRETNGEPPADMLAIYNYEHDKQIDRATKIKQMISEFRNS